MQWCDFYATFWDWSDTTRRTADARVTDIPGETPVKRRKTADIATAIATTVLRIMAIAMVAGIMDTVTSGAVNVAVTVVAEVSR